MLRNYWLLTAFTLALLLIFTGSALAAGDRRPPLADPLSFFQPSNLPTFQPFDFAQDKPSNLPPSTVYRLPSTEGARLFKQWCSACHGDKGQGLTPEWRAEWPEGKQNCWQSKCHAANHPPDGFSIPKKVPALIGSNALTRFSTAHDLYVYSRVTMPYWAPHLLDDHEYLAITTFLVEANYAVKGLPFPVTLSNDLAVISLNPNSQPLASDPSLPTPYFLFPCLSSGCPPKP